MGSQQSSTKSKAHANSFDSQGRVVDTTTVLNIPNGAFQEDHNNANQAGPVHPRWPNTNQVLRGAEAINSYRDEFFPYSLPITLI